MLPALFYFLISPIGIQAKVIEIRCVLEHSADIRTIEKELDVSKHTYNFMHVVYSKQPNQKVEHSL